MLDLRILPEEAFESKLGGKGIYYETYFMLGIELGPGGIEFRAVYNGEIIGSVQCNYFWPSCVECYKYSLITRYICIALSSNRYKLPIIPFGN